MTHSASSSFNDLANRRRDEKPHRTHKASPRNLSVAIWCGLALAAIIAYSRNVDGGTLAGDRHFVFGILIAAFAGLISLFAWAMARQNQRIHESGFWQLLDGLCTLVPPSVIAVTILPINSEWRIWLLGSLLVAGAFLMTTMGELSLFAPAREHRFYRREYLFNERSGSSFLKALRIRQPMYSPGRERPAPVQQRATGEDTITLPREGKVQHQLRRLHARGEDKIEAKWKVRFQADEKRSTVHIPFTPPFSQPPKVELTAPDDAGVTLKVAEVMPYGARLEARRRETGEPQIIVVSLAITAPVREQLPTKPMSRVS